MSLYGIQASFNTELSASSKTLQRKLAGLYSLRNGIRSAYLQPDQFRLATWGPKLGPAMAPANTFPASYLPGVQSGLSSPLTWIEGVFGIESPANILNDAAGIISGIASSLTGAQTAIQNLAAQAHGFDGSSDTATLSKAQACEAEAAGLLSNLQNLQSAAQGLSNQITAAQGISSTDQPTAQALKDQASVLKSQVSTFTSGMNQLASDVAALVKYSQSGPGVVQTLENTAVSSISKLTWLVGGGLMIYFLAPTFIPRLAGGIRKARTA